MEPRKDNIRGPGEKFDILFVVKGAEKRKYILLKVFLIVWDEPNRKNSIELRLKNENWNLSR